ncbi:RdgB/HAM1 family non-canonical purine NTP pyrophosphatase [Pollutibacter soli]|uniref:RdgB/HAM1 family non-canonical purine NTP pyrophosphatase n=1 Tax=Pollutibacter soli TaxID=3034157 RepID=UPI003013F853
MGTMKLIAATHNPNKAREIKRILKYRYEILTLEEAGITESIPEPWDTLEENAYQKSSVIYSITNANCFGEDTGLEVTALDGRPGVKTARYAGENATAEMNLAKLLDALKDKDDRDARFRTIISLIVNGEEYRFEGVCEGKISKEKSGENGFGYDPVFIPNGSEKTFAEMGDSEKDKFSHRRKALEKMGSFLEKFEFH